MRIPEILAPAGDWESFVAAVENGADAVYLGGKTFNARAFAGNFDDDQMQKALEYAHLRRVCLYVTVNIVIDNSELQDAVKYVKKLYDWGVDGIIVQDLGLAFALSRLLPELKIHGSTQMTVHNGEGAEFLADMGMKRVVLAREVSFDDILSIHRETPIELEIFGHGALCISYSGQCLMSSLIGGRSGNRGKCAQPCRMTYRLVDKKGNNVADAGIGDHLLSSKDLNTLELLPKICETGISSLKLEGRMKRPEYVATVVRIYREVLDRLKHRSDEFYVLPEELQQLAQIFNRDFTGGYLLSNPGRDLMSYKKPNNRGIRLGRIEKIKEGERLAQVKLDEKLRVGDGVEIWVTKGGRQGFFVETIYLQGNKVEEADAGDTVVINIQGKPKVGDRIFKTHDVHLIAQARNSYLEPKNFIPLSISLSAREGAPIRLEGWDNEENRAIFFSEYLVEKAKKHPADEAYLKQQLNRLGGTPYQLSHALLDFSEGMMIPASELNAGRRYLVDQISNKRLKKYQHPAVTDDHLNKEWHALLPKKKKEKKSGNLKISVRVMGYEGARAAIEAGADVIYLGGESFCSQKSDPMDEIDQIAALGKEKGREIIYALPDIFHQKEKKIIYNRLEQVKKTKISGLLVGNVGSIKAVQKAGGKGKLCSDIGLNVYNDLSLLFLSQWGIKSAALSLELTFAQIRKINGGALEMECVVHGALPMMVSRYCALGSLVGGKCSDRTCTRPCKKGSFNLKDRLNYLFPLEFDEFCRMHVYNPKDLCLIEHLDQFLESGVRSIRIEGKRYHPETVFQVTNTYRKVKNAILSGTVNYIDFREIQDSLAVFSPAGFTKGHYFRGVL